MMSLPPLAALPAAQADVGALFAGGGALAIAPMATMFVGVLALLLVDVLRAGEGLRRGIVVVTLAAALGFELRTLGVETPRAVLEGSLVLSGHVAAFGALFVFATGLAWAFGLRYYTAERAYRSEHDVLLLCSATGMMLMAAAGDLIAFFVGLELLSVPLYALAAFRRARADSVEAGLKYFVLGAFSAGLFLYGAALLYAGTGSISLEELRATGASGPLALAGLGLVAASVLFKISVFPFHLWVPDVYQGSPTPVTTFMATGTKVAGFAFLLRLSFLLPTAAAPTLALIALLTMAAGNLGALVQADLKRMLAYSGVAHAGTLLLAVAGGLAGDPHPDGATQAALYYLAAYVFTAGGAFGLIAALEAAGEGPLTLEGVRGLARRRPAVAAALAFFALSLGGIPITGGFLGKWLVFSVAVRADLILVAVLGALLSVVALGYYLRIVVAMYMQPEAEGQSGAPTVALAPASSLAAGVCAVAVLLLGVAPGLFLGLLP